MQVACSAATDRAMRLLSESGSRFGSSGVINVAIGNDGWSSSDSTNLGPSKGKSPLCRREKPDGMLEKRMRKSEQRSGKGNEKKNKHKEQRSRCQGCCRR
jgi:hypothetical protein